MTFVEFIVFRNDTTFYKKTIKLETNLCHTLYILIDEYMIYHRNNDPTECFNRKNIPSKIVEISELLLKFGPMLHVNRLEGLPNYGFSILRVL
jgi:hypothetical protein